MKREGIHIRQWLFAISFLLLAVACSSSDESGEQQPTTLTVYVYSPEHPLLIRGDVGNVNASFDEKKITRLQIWVFTNGTHEKVAYLDTKETSQLNVGEGAVYQLPVSDDFAQSKPDVDVYVLANIPKEGYASDSKLDGNSTRDAILSATIPENYFGLTSPMTTQVPNDGLPMAGALTSQPVIGEAPVLRVGTSSSIATVRLERAVSKVCFVFANTVGEPELKIKNIQLNAQMIPNTEYLIQQTKTLSYNAIESSLWTAEDVVEKVDDPTIYIYGGQEAQVYEDLIDQSTITKIGPFYLRESDKQLEGKIYYKIGDEAKEADFQMEAAGDFRRNHTWIVYAYHAGGGFLQMNAIYVKEWTTKEKNHEIYNW
ncbi:MAG: hypothetical protein J6E48_06640 [Prevotella sp.]|nr:hypothetical protein [Prevotella sp.]